MNKAEKIAAARKRLTEAQREKAAHIAKRAEKAKAEAAAQKKLAALVRKGPMIVYKETEAGRPQHATDLTGFSVGYGTGTEKLTTEKQYVEVLSAPGSALKLTMPGANLPVAPSTVIKRTRLVSDNNARAILAARRARDRAVDRQRAAQKALETIEAEAFDAGTKFEPAILFRQIGAAIIAKRAIPGRYGLDDDVHEDRRDESAIAAAEAHLAAMKSGAECDCGECRMERKAAADAKAEAERRAALPHLLLTCPTHGKRRMPWERRSMWLPSADAEKLGFVIERDPWGQGSVQVKMPVAFCPGGDQLRIPKIIEADNRAARKAAEQAAKLAAKVAARRQNPKDPGIATGATVTFTCPACGDAATSDVYEDDDDEGRQRVECDSCGMTPLVASVVIHKERKAA